MLKVLGLAAIALGGHRAYQAKKAGVPLDRAFNPRDLLTPIARLAPLPKPAPVDPDDVMIPSWYDDDR